MRYQLLLTATVFAVQGVLSGVANAHCDPEFLRTNLSWSSDTETNLAILNIIDEDSFTANQRSLRNSGSAIVGGVPFSSLTTFSRFDAARARHFKLHSFEQTKKVSQRYVLSYLPESGKEAYVACLRAPNKFGFTMWTQNVTKDHVTLSIVWRDTQGNDLADFQMFPEGGDIIGSKPNSLEHDKVTILKFSRKKALNEKSNTDEPLEFSLVVSGGGAPEKLVVPAVPRIQTAVRIKWEFKINRGDPGYFEDSRTDLITVGRFDDGDIYTHRLVESAFSTETNYKSFCYIYSDWSVEALYKDRYLTKSRSGARSTTQSKAYSPGSGGHTVCTVQAHIFNY